MFFMIDLVLGDITKMQVDAIVNAANTSLMGGGGVDGAIHRVGGIMILEDCREIIKKQGRCKVGEAVITRAGNLSANYVIHTVGPVWNIDHEKEKKLLENCYSNVLRLAISYDIRSIAFPNISTGKFKFPKAIAADIAVKSCLEFLRKKNCPINSIHFVCYDEENFLIYKKLLEL